MTGMAVHPLWLTTSHTALSTLPMNWLAPIIIRMSLYGVTSLQPKELTSPTLVLERQEGSSFDMACLLCSLLLGVGYDAYCVCGYAVREVTEMDQCGKTCPGLETGEEVCSEPTHGQVIELSPLPSGRGTGHGGEEISLCCTPSTGFEQSV